MRTPLTLLVCLFFATASLGFAQVAADEITAPGKKAPRGQLLEWKSDAGQPYWYHVPKKFSKDRPPALILMLHGTGGNQGWSFWNYPIVAGKFRPDDIVVSPDGVTPGGGTTFNFVQGKKDGEQIAEIIASFRKAYPEIDRVYLYGHSQGAFFCYWYAGEYADTLDGIIAHAGNVLSVQHDKKAKKGVGIGILHGRADAVVGVVCAYRTFGIYHAEGYQKLKLEIVEGLNERSGHWPLPIQVGQMLDWLDSVTITTPEVGFDVMEALLDAEQPDLNSIATSLLMTEDVVDSAKGRKAKTYAARAGKLRRQVERVAKAHAGALEKTAGAVGSSAEFAEWVGHFREVDRALADWDAWSDPMKKARKLVAKHDKVVEKALDGITVKNAKAFSRAREAWQVGFLAARHDELEGRLILLAEDRPAYVEAEDAAQFLAELQARTPVFEAGRAEAMRITKKGL
jgi:predicted esterase